MQNPRLIPGAGTDLFAKEKRPAEHPIRVTVFSLGIRKFPPGRTGTGYADSDANIMVVRLTERDVKYSTQVEPYGIGFVCIHSRPPVSRPPHQATHRTSLLVPSGASLRA
jgi:hypothetical protein